MSGLGAFRRRLDDTQLVERDKDDSLGAAELWLENLDHRHVGPIKLQHATPCTGRRIVYALGQLDDVEGGDLVGYRHGSFMLRGRVGGDQPRCGPFDKVVPGNNCERNAAVERELGLHLAGNPEWRAITHSADGGVKRRSCDGSPEKLPVNEAYSEYPLPFVAMSSRPEDPFQLGKLVPGIRSTGEGFSYLRRPRHRPDARGAAFTRVRRKSILRIVNRTQLEQSR
jgi:hypothetical protein